MYICMSCAAQCNLRKKSFKTLKYVKQENQ